MWSVSHSNRSRGGLIYCDYGYDSDGVVGLHFRTQLPAHVHRAKSMKEEKNKKFSLRCSACLGKVLHNTRVFHRGKQVYMKIQTDGE